VTKNRVQGGAAMVVYHKQAGQDHDEDSRQSGLSRRASLDSLGPGLSDIENMEEGLPEPHRRKVRFGTGIDPLARTWYILGWLARKLRDGNAFYPPV
jgi:hypothetical protein